VRPLWLKGPPHPHAKDASGEVVQDSTQYTLRSSENKFIMESFLLEGAPDGSIGTPDARTNAVQVMHLDMSNEILDDLLECIRKGKAPQVLFGKNPVCSHCSLLCS
jgi:hypothetical protein